MSDLFACLIVDTACSFLTASAVFTVALLASTVLGNERPLLLSLQCGGVVFVASFVVLLFVQGGAKRGKQ